MDFDFRAGIVSNLSEKRDFTNDIADGIQESFSISETFDSIRERFTRSRLFARTRLIHVQ